MRTDKQLTADLRRYLKTLKAFDFAAHERATRSKPVAKCDKRHPIVIGGPRGSLV